MQRFCRSHLLWIGCCVCLVVFIYVLFDLLDVDGFNFDQSFGSCTAAEERTACEDPGRHLALDLSSPRLPPQPDPCGSIRSVTPPTLRVSRSILLHGRPRAMLSAQGTASSPPEADPAGPLADH